MSLIGYIDAASERAIWLLDLEIGGHCYRVASEACDVSDARGSSWHYEPGLGDIDASRVEAGALDASIDLEIDIGEDWAAIEARGHSLERARGVLRRWWEGTVLEDAQVYLVGLTADAQYGESTEVLSCALVRAPAGCSDTLPTPTQLVSSRLWPVAAGGQAVAQGILGCHYPIVIGCPGNDPSAANPRAAVPAMWVEYSPIAVAKVLLAGHALTATTIRCHNATEVAEEDLTPATDADLLGQPCSTAQPTGTTLEAQDDEMWWGVSSTNGGGLVNPWQPGQPLRGACDVIGWVWIQHTTLDVDAPRLWGARTWLNRYKIDTYINTPTVLTDWLESILGLLPVIPRQSVDGLWLQPVRWDYRPEDAVASLSAERHEIERASQFRRLSQDIYNEITVNYRPGRGKTKWYSTITVTAEQGFTYGALGTVADTSVQTAFLAERSQAIYGPRPLVIDVPWTWDDATATALAFDALLRYSYPKRTVSYLADRTFNAIEPGSCVLITDSAVSLSSALAYVVDSRPRESAALLDLILLDHPVSRTEATS